MTDANHEDFRQAGHKIIDFIAQYWREMENHRVAPDVDREELFSRLTRTVPDDGIGLDRGIAELGPIFDAAMAMSHPLYLGLVNSSPLPEAVLGDLLVSALDNNGGASHQGPVHAAAEQEVVRWLTERLGYRGDGMILPGGSHATLQALQIAKAHVFPEWVRFGPSAMGVAPRLYTSNATHFSVTRAAKVIGLGHASLGLIPVNGRGALDAKELETTIQSDLRRDLHPFAVVATVGSTGTGAIDPLDEIAAICRRHKLWLHVDACYGGAAALLDEHRDRFTGLLEADSIAIDLHKWFFMPLTAGVLLTRHGQTANELFGVSASYIPEDGFTEAYARGLPTSRRATGLAVWFGLRTAGWTVIAEAIQRNIALSRDIERQLERHGFRVLADGELSIACARWEPPGYDAESLDALQTEISDRIQRGGQAWFATTRHAEQTWLRINMVNLHTRQRHVDQLVEMVAKTANQCCRT